MSFSAQQIAEITASEKEISSRHCDLLNAKCPNIKRCEKHFKKIFMAILDETEKAESYGILPEKSVWTPNLLMQCYLEEIRKIFNWSMKNQSYTPINHYLGHSIISTSVINTGSCRGAIIHMRDRDFLENIYKQIKNLRMTYEVMLTLSDDDRSALTKELNEDMNSFRRFSAEELIDKFKNIKTR